MGLKLAEATDQAPPIQNYDHSPFSLLMMNISRVNESRSFVHRYPQMLT